MFAALNVERDRLETARLALEPIQHRHDDDLQEAVIASMPELERWMPWAPGHTLATQREFVDRALEAREDGSEHHFAIVLDGRAIGTVGLRRQAPGVYEIGYWIRSDCAGRGYMTEAAQAVVDLAFTRLGAQRLILNAGVDNTRSLRVAAKLGFTRAGLLPGGMDGGLGRHFEAYAHELERPD